MGSSKVNDILVFMAVVDCGSFVAGGRTLGLSRSAAGKAIARLEERFGNRLLNRTPRAISLTEEGQELYTHGQAIQAAIDAADASMAGSRGNPTGTLRITAPDALGRKLLLPVIKKFQKQWPDVHCEVHFSDNASRIVEDGFDLAIRIGVTAPDQSLVSRTLLRDTPILCAAPSYISERAQPSNIEQLSTHDLLQFSSGGARQAWELRDTSEGIGIVPGRVRLRLNSAQGLLDAARAGMGIALLPQILVNEDLARGTLQRILPDVSLGTIPLIALYPHKRFLEPRVRQFLDMLAADLRQQ